MEIALIGHTTNGGTVVCIDTDGVTQLLHVLHGCKVATVETVAAGEVPDDDEMRNLVAALDTLHTDLTYARDTTLAVDNANAYNVHGRKVVRNA